MLLAGPVLQFVQPKFCKDSFKRRHNSSNNTNNNNTTTTSKGILLCRMHPQATAVL